MPTQGGHRVEPESIPRIESRAKESVDRSEESEAHPDNREIENTYSPAGAVPAAPQIQAEAGAADAQAEASAADAQAKAGAADTDTPPSPNSQPEPDSEASEAIEPDEDPLVPEDKEMLPPDGAEPLVEETAQLAQIRAEWLSHYGLTEDEARAGESLHRSPQAFQEELSALDTAKRYNTFNAEIETAVLTLITHGYTAAQAFAAYVSGGVLGVSREELIRAREAEIAAEIQSGSAGEAETAAGLAGRGSFLPGAGPAKGKEAFSRIGKEGWPDLNGTVQEQRDPGYLRLSGELGVPYAIIESYMVAQAESAEALLERYQAARQATYFPEQAREPQASGPQRSGYSPSTLVDIKGRPTEKPYTYRRTRILKST
jgi:hypothetical protein